MRTNTRAIVGTLVGIGVRSSNGSSTSAGLSLPRFANAALAIQMASLRSATSTSLLSERPT